MSYTINSEPINTKIILKNLKSNFRNHFTNRSKQYNLERGKVGDTRQESQDLAEHPST